jgi:small-conductance mechanosensitive channel
MQTYRSPLLIELFFLIFIFLATSCASDLATPTSTPTPSIPTPSATTAAGVPTAGVIGLGEITSLDDFAMIAAQRTPLPTRVPSAIQEIAQEIAEESGLDEKSLLGLSVTSWIDLAISILIMVFFIYIGLRLIMALIKAIVRRTKNTFDDEFLAYIERELKWLIAIVVAGRFAVLRLEFLSDRWRLLLEDFFFLLGLGVLFIIVLRLIHFTSVWIRRNKLTAEQRKQLGPFIVLLNRLGYLLAGMLAVSSVLSHFGVEVTILTAVFLFGAVVIVLGARAAISDAVSGFFILVSRPFRVNDTIYIKELDTRGEVEEIGIRTTHIGTRDGREVIVPNGLIGASQVINYTYPDPNYRVEIDLLTNGADVEQIRQIIEETVRAVDGVLEDKPVDVLYLSYGGTGRQFRVRWWIDDVNKHNRSRNLVNTALDNALEEAGIGTPNLTYDLNLKMENEDALQAATNPPGEKS